MGLLIAVGVYKMRYYYCYKCSLGRNKLENIVVQHEPKIRPKVYMAVGICIITV